MDELIKFLNVLVELKYFVLSHSEDRQVPGYHLFKLIPMSDTEFPADFYELLCQFMPSDISCRKTKLNIKFSASPADQYKLINAFSEILRLRIGNNQIFFSLLTAYKDEQPFVRLLSEYKTLDIYNEATTPNAEEKIHDEIAEQPTAAPHNEQPIPDAIASVDPVATVDETPAPAPALELTPEPTPPVTPTQVRASFYYSDNSVTAEHTTKPSREDRLNSQLQHSLACIIRLMDAATTPPKMRHLFDFYSGISSVVQQTKNILNPLVGDAEAAINMREKLRAYSKITGRNLYQNELEYIMKFVVTRLLHVQQAHLKDSHAEEITHLTSAEQRLREIRTIVQAREAIQSSQSDEPSTQASPGYHS